MVLIGVKKTAKEITEELKVVLPELGITSDLLDYDINKPSPSNEHQNAFKLWHLLYSAEDDVKASKEDMVIYGQTDVNLKKALHQKFGIPVKYVSLFSSIALQPDYGSLCARAIKKVIPHLQAGHVFSEAAKLAGYNHSNSLTKAELDKRELKPKLELLKKNSLRNPVVEKILNQMVNVINQIIASYGKPDEIRIELARELKKSAKQRAEMTKFINTATRINDDIRKTITKDFGIPNPTKNDLVRYKLWLELKDNGFHSIFTNTYIPKEKLFSKEIDIEHIIPKAILFDDSFSNKTLAYREVNLKKGARTGVDFISEDFFEELANYKARVESLYNNGKGSISKSKYKKLLMSRAQLPDSFIESDLKNTQYIAKKALQMLQEVCKTVVPTNGTITDKLREDWDLINVMKELNMPKYELAGLTEIEKRKGGKEVKVIKDWTKRNDHRHHAMDALAVAFTTHNHIQYINNLNAASNKDSRLYAIKQKITALNKNGKRIFTPPMDDFRQKAKNELEKVLVSFKAKNKVVTKNINKTKKKGKGQFNSVTQLTPRGQLHKETVYAKRKMKIEKPVKIDKKLTLKKTNLIIHEGIKQIVLERLKKHDYNPLKAFDAKVLKKEPLLYKGDEVKAVHCFEEIYTIRKDITPELKLDKVVDLGIKKILQARLAEYGGDAKKAFSDLENKPIWLNKKAGVTVKRVSVTGVSNAEALHFKKDQFGNDILENGKKIPADFVSTGNNHHVAIYEDENGELHDNVVSFYEVVERVNQKLPIINKTYNVDLGWQFLFSMKQNEMFLFPADDFVPNQIDLLDPKNLTEISKNLFRVQKFSKVTYGNSAVRDYVFRHHFESQINDNKNLKDITYKSIKSLKFFKAIVKVRLNHLGEIVYIGEY
jgi:CRISPR-associated endonuclease Csn1